MKRFKRFVATIRSIPIRMRLNHLERLRRRALADLLFSVDFRMAAQREYSDCCQFVDLHKAPLERKLETITKELT